MLAHGVAQPGFEHRGESVSIIRPAEHASDHIAANAKSKSTIQSQHQVSDFKWKMQPLAAQQDTAMTITVCEISTEHTLKVPENLRVAGGVQTMAAKIQELPINFETSRIAAKPLAALNKRHACDALASQLAGSAAASRPAAQYDYMGFIHGSSLTGTLVMVSTQFSDAALQYSAITMGTPALVRKTEL